MLVTFYFLKSYFQILFFIIIYIYNKLKFKSPIFTQNYVITKRKNCARIDEKINH